MRYIFLLIIMSLVTMNLTGQKVHSKKVYKNLDHMVSYEVHGPTVICHHSDEVIREYVEKSMTKPPYTKKSNTTFNVSYEPNANFPQEVIDAFEIGTLPLVAELFSTNIPINIWVENLALSEDTENTLAAAGPGDLFQFIANSPCLDCIYPVALAEKLLDQELTPSTGLEADADLNIFINPEADFFFDFNNPDGVGNQIDFVTTMFHEVLHAIGFTGIAGQNMTGEGFLESMANTASIYDNYMETITGENLRESFDNGSFRLGAALSSNGLFWNGFNIGQVQDRAVLFAPTQFNPGSCLLYTSDAADE